MTRTTKKTGKKPEARSSSKVVSVKAKKPFTNYRQAIAYLFEKTDYEKEEHVRYNVTTFSLDRMRSLLSLLGDPHAKISTVHIAGTKGKGSTATMLAKMLESNGYTVGLYTSPHLVHLHERIVVNSEMISEAEMLGLMNRIYAPVEKLSDDPPTFFEIFTALAFMYFADRKVDIAVIETGLGGRLDSTNVITPKVVGITSLSIDHKLQLGDTLDRIAMEKAGVFKKGVPTITVQQEPIAMSVLKEQAIAVKAPLSVTGSSDIDFSYRFETSREHGPHTRICLTTATSKFEHIRVPLHGKHQAINCGLALALLDRLKSSGYNIDIDKAADGLHGVTLAGRMEMICEDPRIMIDGAHNAASVRALIHAIGQNIPYDSMVVIFGCNADKDIPGMLTELQYGADKVIFTRSSSMKAVSPQDLADMYTDICGKMCQTASSLGEALQLARSAVGREDLILITGSFYLIGQAKIRFQPSVTLAAS